MPLTGGATDKIGNRYEGLWTVRCMIDVISENADAIRLEPPGTEGKGVEFWIRRGNVREHHQVKRQLSEGRWTLYQLSDAGVLGNFLGKLRQEDATCVFVSMYAADQVFELADRARDASSLDEFRAEFLSSEPLKQDFATLQAHWSCSEAEAYQYLRRIYVRTYDERSLREDVRDRLLALVEGDPALVEAFLSQLALDKIHQELNAFDLWRHLTEQGFRRLKWGDDPRVFAAVDSANDRYLASFTTPTIGGQLISRGEVEEVLAALTEGGSTRGVLLAGEAGVGKSGVLLQLLSVLRERGTPLLALRVDRLELAQRPEDVGRQLGLPGSPAAVLDAVASGRDCVLVLDQLDAVSLASGRRPDLFDCIAELARQAASRPNVFVVLACRRFDLDNDHRFRHLVGERGIAKPLQVKRLPEATVREVVAKLGLDASRLSASQVSLLEAPLHLSLLAEIAPDPSTDPLGFETATELYSKFWNRKQDLIRLHRGSPAQHWLAIMDRLSGHMSSQQTLTAPRRIVEEFEADVRAIVSEHVLVQDEEGRKLAFFHDGFFDYVFARRFLARGDDLLGLLRRGEQGLFRRAQVRQILAYERDEDPAQYLDDLRAVFDGMDIRSHIKEVAFALLAQLKDPMPEEWRVIAPLMANGGFLALHSWNMLRGSPRWFRLLDGLGVIESWLAGEDEDRADRAVLLLSSVYEALPDRVAQLVTPYIRASERWDDRLRFLTQRPIPHEGRAFLDLFLRLIDEGVLDEANRPNRDLWLSIYRLPEQRPGWACEVIGHYFNRHLTLAIANDVRNPFGDDGTIPNSDIADTVLTESARRDPKAFVDAVLPFVVRVVERTADQDAEPPVQDEVWWIRYPGKPFGLDAVLLASVEIALRRLAAVDPEEFERFASPLLSSKFDTVQYLLARGLSANGERFADSAADFLCEHPYRLSIGYASDAHWATRDLLAAITPHCSDQRLARLEAAILEYYPPGETDPEGRRWRGAAQFVLLDGIDDRRRGNEATRRLQELRRKFGESRPTAPMGIVGGRVVSPVPESAVETMTDDQWLSAIAKHASDRTREVKGNQIIGGASELAQQLTKQTEEDPNRFALLAERIPDDANPVYFEAVLRGLEAATDRVDLERVVAVCERCHRLPERPCGRGLAYLLGKLAEASLPERLLEILGWYATEDADPEQEVWRVEASSGRFYYGGDIESAGLNTVRGGAAGAIAHMLVADPNRVKFFRPVMDRLVEDKSLAVRSQVARALTAVLLHDREAAVGWFERLCQTEDALLSARSIERFLQFAMTTHYSVLKPVLELMISAEDADTVRAGARQVCLAALDLPEAQPLANSCLSGADPMRLGAAEVYAANLRLAGLRTVCEDALLTLFHDPSAAVRSAAATCFRELEAAELGKYRELAAAFIDSPAFAVGYRTVLDALDRTTADVADTICQASERFLDIAGDEVADVRTRTAAEADDVSRLVVRAYGQARDGATRDRCLDLIDRMTEFGAWGLDKAVALYER